MLKIITSGLGKNVEKSQREYKYTLSSADTNSQRYNWRYIPVCNCLLEHVILTMKMLIKLKFLGQDLFQRCGILKTLVDTSSSLVIMVFYINENEEYL